MSYLSLLCSLSCKPIYLCMKRAYIFLSESLQALLLKVLSLPSVPLSIYSEITFNFDGQICRC